jgi:hypothetical protein
MYRPSSLLYCFSPPVMLATFIFELGLAIYTIVRFKLTPITRVITAMLLLLALFQFVEFNVCGRSSASAALWSRIGYVAITLLPPLALHLIYLLAKRKKFYVVWLAYASGIAFALIFSLRSAAFSNYICGGNYVIFRLTRPVGAYYFAYYYLWIFVGIGAAMYFGRHAKKPVRDALLLMIFGYLSFLLPTGIVNTINPQSLVGVPSIMCGFAVIYAIILVFGIASKASKRL